MKENLKLNCGILKEDIKPILDAATEKDVIIMFRSTGPYARPWLEQGYPSKNFHIKGKTSNLGFIAGLVPFQGTFSKVWWDNNSAKKCDEANQKAIVDGSIRQPHQTGQPGVRQWRRVGERGALQRPCLCSIGRSLGQGR